jgi:hypothetical protein
MALVGMDFGNTIRALIAPERIEVSESSIGINIDPNEKMAAGLNSRPASQLKEIITLIGFVHNTILNLNFNKNIIDNLLKIYLEVVKKSSIYCNYSLF